MLYNTVCFSLFQRVMINLEPFGYMQWHQQVSGSIRCLPSNCQDFTANRTCSVCKLFFPSNEIAIHNMKQMHPKVKLSDRSAENQTSPDRSTKTDTVMSVNGYYCLRRCRVARWRRHGYHWTAVHCHPRLHRLQACQLFRTVNSAVCRGMLWLISPFTLSERGGGGG